MSFFYIAICLLLNYSICHTLDCYIIVDAGSSGTRANIYSWQETISNRKQINFLGRKSIKSPITHIHNTNQAYQLFNELISFAKKTIDNQCDETAIYIKATAGMRSHSLHRQQNILSIIQELLTNQSFNPYPFQKEYASVISGKEEGLYEWLTINYVNSKKPNSNRFGAFGVVTSGGASVQICFVPFTQDINAKDIIEFNLNLNENMKIYSQTYLGLGHSKMWNKVVTSLSEQAISNNKTYIKNPCLFKGHNISTHLSNGVQIEQLGSSQPKQCRNVIKQVFVANELNIYSGKPKLPSHMTFYGTQFLSNSIAYLNLPSKIDLYHMSQTVFDLCSQDFNTSKHRRRDERDYCFHAMYSLYLLSDIFSFPIDKPIIFTNQYSWTLGFVLYIRLNHTIQDLNYSHGNETNETDFLSVHDLFTGFVLINGRNMASIYFGAVVVFTMMIIYNCMKKM